tara:strand:+ start:385 stop:777 length:393 start_codon:yes stop_codon:yes gene_type:complete
MTTGLFWKYTDEAYDDWVEEHVNWMTNNVPTQVSEAFENEIESLLNDTDRHAFMLYHLLHMSTLDEGDAYRFREDATEIWNLTIPLMQAFNTMMMGLAASAGDEDTVHAIGLSNALMLRMFVPNTSDDEE